MVSRRAPMLASDHAGTARDFLAKSEAEFAAGDRLQASEKLWGAASHAVMAVARQRGWFHGSHRSLKDAAKRLSDEHNDPLIEYGFAVAEKFHSNFYHDHMDDFELESDRPKVHDCVHRALALLRRDGA